MKTGDCDSDDLYFTKRTFNYYNRYVMHHYLHKIAGKEQRVSEFIEKLNAYRPRKTKYCALIDWFKRAVMLYQNGFDYESVAQPKSNLNRYYTDELRPYSYVRFIWSAEDDIGCCFASDLSEGVGHYGIQPLIELCKMTRQNIENPKQCFGVVDEFYEWMSGGHELVSKI